MPANPAMILNFVLENETKGSLRYMEVDANGVEKPFGAYAIGKIYFRKTALPSKPQKIVVQVTV